MTATSQPPPTVAHVRRGDLQGLRGVAVLLVVAFHAFSWPRGGFVGVDVFFVISGFVITTRLVRESETTGAISLLGFYQRRLRRIAPAAAVTLAAIAVSTSLLSASRAREVRIDALWALVGAENWRQLVTSLHPQLIGESSPVAHYWSLGIEEQFYLLWPLVFLMAILVGRRWRVRPTLLIAASTLTATSLMISAVLPSGIAYFSTLSRAWELGLGGVIALASGKLALLSRFARSLLATVGLCAVTFAALVHSTEGTLYRGTDAALPALGAAALIIAGIGVPTFASRLLESRPLQATGDISYSLYLWHVPVIVYVSAVLPSSGLIGAGTAVLAGVALAWLSYRFVEKPFRGERRPSEDGRPYGALPRLLQPRRTMARPAMPKEGD